MIAPSYAITCAASVMMPTNKMMAKSTLAIFSIEFVMLLSSMNKSVYEFRIFLEYRIGKVCNGRGEYA